MFPTEPIHTLNDPYNYSSRLLQKLNYAFKGQSYTKVIFINKHINVNFKTNI